MSKLLALIDDYKDRTGGPSDSSIARAIGISPQALHSWRRRGIKEPPNVDTLRNLAALMRVDYRDVVLTAVLIDIGLLEESDGDDGPRAAPMNEAK